MRTNKGRLMRLPKYITSFIGFHKGEILALCLCHPINVFRLSVIRQRKFKRMKSEQQDQNKFTKERFSKSMAQTLSLKVAFSYPKSYCMLPHKRLRKFIQKLKPDKSKVHFRLSEIAQIISILQL